MGGVTSTEVSPQVTQFVNQAIAENGIVIFSKSYCPYCVRVKSLFQSLNQSVYCIELDQRSEGSEIQNELYRLTNQSTVPNVFIHGQHIGGCDDTTALHRQGRLIDILNKQRQQQQ